MSKDAQAIEIDISKKYVLIFERKLSDAEKHQVKSLVQEWLESSDPFLMIDGGDVKLVKVEDVEVENG